MLVQITEIGLTQVQCEWPADAPAEERALGWFYRDDVIAALAEGQVVAVGTVFEAEEFPPAGVEEAPPEPLPEPVPPAPEEDAFTPPPPATFAGMPEEEPTP